MGVGVLPPFSTHHVSIPCPAAPPMDTANVCFISVPSPRCRDVTRLLPNFSLDGVQFFTCFGPFALCGQFPRAAQVVLDQCAQAVEPGRGNNR